jgi:hypothetical protein
MNANGRELHRMMPVLPGAGQFWSFRGGLAPGAGTAEDKVLFAFIGVRSRLW